MIIRNKIAKSVILFMSGMLIASISIISMADETAVKNEAIVESGREIEELETSNEADAEIAEAETHKEADGETDEPEISKEVDEEAANPETFTEVTAETTESATSDEIVAETAEAKEAEETKEDNTDTETSVSETNSLKTAETVEATTEKKVLTESGSTAPVETNPAETNLVEETMATESKPLSETIIGTWSIDEITFIKFCKGSTGCLILPNNEFSFTYKIKNDQLMLDFASGKAADGTYTVCLSDDEMVLEGGKGTIGSSFNLNKIE